MSSALAYSVHLKKVKEADDQVVLQVHGVDEKKLDLTNGR